jgi:hypothetical protein
MNNDMRKHLIGFANLIKNPEERIQQAELKPIPVDPVEIRPAMIYRPGMKRADVRRAQKAYQKIRLGKNGGQYAT